VQIVPLLRLMVLCQVLVGFCVVVASPGYAETGATNPKQLASEVAAYPYTEQIKHQVLPVIFHEVGLGPLEKRQGRWSYKNAERLSGELGRWTWQVADGFASADLHELLSQRLAAIEQNKLLYSCKGRACGPGAQWANSIFGQRILYGRDQDQWYSVYRYGTEFRVLIYSSARTPSRQYLHLEVLEILPQ